MYLQGFNVYKPQLPCGSPWKLKTQQMSKLSKYQDSCGPGPQDSKYWRQVLDKIPSFEVHI